MNASAAAFFGTSTPNTANRNIVINALASHALGSNVYPATATAIQNEVNALLTRIPGLNSSATVATATTAACTAVLGSAAVSLQ